MSFCTETSLLHNQTREMNLKKKLKIIKALNMLVKRVKAQSFIDSPKCKGLEGHTYLQSQWLGPLTK